MPLVETAPQPLSNPLDAQQEAMLSAITATTPEGLADRPAASDHAGSAALHSTEPALHAEMHPEGHPGAGELPDTIDDSLFDEISVAANGGVRPEDGRVQDVEAAHAEAIEENKMFDLYTEAMEEDKKRTADLEAQKENEKAQVEEEPAKTEVTATDSALSAQGDVRAQARVALQEAGVPVQITEQTKIIKEPFGNAMTVVNGDHIQVVRANGIDGKYHVTDYRFDRTNNTVKIGDGSFMPADKYAPQMPDSGEQPQDVVVLPTAVANVVGFDRVVPSGGHAPAPNEAPAMPQS
jgi:hypothetical protein